MPGPSRRAGKSASVNSSQAQPALTTAEIFPPDPTLWLATDGLAMLCEPKPAWPPACEPPPFGPIRGKTVCRKDSNIMSTDLVAGGCFKRFRLRRWCAIIAPSSGGRNWQGRTETGAVPLKWSLWKFTDEQGGANPVDKPFELQYRPGKPHVFRWR